MSIWNWFQCMYNIQQACYPFAIISRHKNDLTKKIEMSYKRILVHLQLQPGGAPVLAKFTNCILSSLQPDHQHSMQVSVELKEDRLILSHPATNSTPALLTHPPFCPAFCLSPSQSKALPDETSKRGVDVGVVVLLETADTCLLLTRRAAHMRTFPGTWVPPGGHVESGEGLLEAGLRELGEETGLVLPPSTIACLPLLACLLNHCLLFWRASIHTAWAWVLQSGTTLSPTTMSVPQNIARHCKPGWSWMRLRWTQPCGSHPP